ncbi:MAG: hypothetical protein C4576_30355 [Desulfobacteraceae bacterium]|nr:MAG: hypothetical protein C4576_30355 [Desulfobacteraceae bacterium]
MNSNVEAFKILSIDGGGIRGIVPAAVLTEVERAIRKQMRGSPVRIGECFDLIAGTSTGGILTCMLLFPDKKEPSRARFSASDALRLYMENGDDVFERSVWQMIVNSGGLSNEKYSANTLERILSYYFEDISINELIRPCLITAYDSEKYQPFFFNQNDARNDQRGSLIRDVAGEGATLPTSFDAVLPANRCGIPVIDGGAFTNNPAACALVEALGLRSQNPIRFSEIVMLSLGTGQRPESLSYGQCCNEGLTGWIMQLVGILMEGVSQTVHYQLKTVFESIGKRNQYLRIDGTYRDFDLEDFDPDLTSEDVIPETMKRLERFGRLLAESHREDIQAFVQSYF